MCYCCSICRDVVGPGVKLVKFVQYRWVGRMKQIAREWPICPECEEDLDAGVSLRVMLEEHQRERQEHVPPVAPPSQPVRPALIPVARPVRPIRLFGRAALANRVKNQQDQ
jgi:hypothetical protein